MGKGERTVSAAWFPDDWPGWQRQKALHASGVDGLDPDDWRWLVRERIGCPLCGAPNGVLCARDNGTATLLIHTPRARQGLARDGNQ